MRQRVLVSIDTEGPDGKSPIEKMVYGKLNDGKEYGINYIMDFLDAHNIKGLFFVDIAEAWDYGEDKVESVINCISKRGHNVGVHIHPDHMADKNRRYMWQYTYDEQYQIIKKCTDMYEKILHKKPISFRAGRYGANNDTLNILNKLGYKYDMSEFYGNRYCKIEPPVTCNRVITCDNLCIKEVPVTSYKSFVSPLYSRHDQIDSGLSPSEFARSMKFITKEKKVDVMSMFIHSFQFLDWRKDPDNPKYAKANERKFQKNFELLETKYNVQFISEEDLQDLLENEDDKIGFLDVSKGLLPIWYFFVRAISVMRDKLTNNV